MFKPAVVCAVLWLLVPNAFATWLAGCITFLLVNIMLNSRMGKAVGEALLQSLVNFYEALRAGLLPGLLRLLSWAFKQTIDTMEYVLFTVDEWLRFRSGDSRCRWSCARSPACCGIPVASLARFYHGGADRAGHQPDQVAGVVRWRPSSWCRSSAT